MPQHEIEVATERLAQAIRESEEYILYSGLKEAVMSDETNRTLLKEYQKTQAVLQMAAMAGKEADEDTVQRFSQLSSLLYMNNEVAQYLLAQLRVQKLAGDVFGQLAAAAGLEFDLPGM
ncbi:MAG: YlbF family regulator [Candidatus Limiplasma sp.]|nr:YlbF family regulator [Candidatus Limiplasma sp.]